MKKKQSLSGHKVGQKLTNYESDSWNPPPPPKKKKKKKKMRIPPPPPIPRLHEGAACVFHFFFRERGDIFASNLEKISQESLEKGVFFFFFFFAFCNCQYGNQYPR